MIHQYVPHNHDPLPPEFYTTPPAIVISWPSPEPPELPRGFADYTSGLCIIGQVLLAGAIPRQPVLARLPGWGCLGPAPNALK
jgi:hypothetical protein